MAECPHGEAMPEVCPPCQRGSATLTADVGPWRTSFTARYDGRCGAECGSRIEAGDTIRGRLNDGDWEYMHDDCTEDAG